jgi:hypothetical protein
VLYVYALTDEPELPARPPRGHRGAPLRVVVGAGGVSAVCTRHRDLAVAVEERHLWRHERVTEALMEDRAVLPVRFGTTVADEDTLRTLLEDRADELRAALQRVRGRVEIGVRVLWTPPPAPPDDDGSAAPGTAYLRGRLRVQSAAQRIADDVHERIAARAVAAQRRVLVTPRLLLSGAYLVERSAIDDLLAAADAGAREHPGTEVLCTGPWPPHSFADATVGAT